MLDCRLFIASGLQREQPTAQQPNSPTAPPHLGLDHLPPPLSALRFSLVPSSLFLLIRVLPYTSTTHNSVSHPIPVISPFALSPPHESFVPMNGYTLGQISKFVLVPISMHFLNIFHRSSRGLRGA
jgi:hypothetical protein